MAGFRSFSGDVAISEHDARAVDAAHRHQTAYAALVCEGAYLEFSADGPVRASAGDIVLHPPFHQHKNLFESRDVKVLNLALPFEAALRAGYGVLHGGAEAVTRLAEKNTGAAIDQILNRAGDVRRSVPRMVSALDNAADALRDDPFLPVSAVAQRAGFAHSYFTRAFTKRFGISPASFRAEHRFRRALDRILASNSLADAASDAGYADQAHMTRDFRRRTGVTPASLGREVKFVQDGAPAR